VVVFAGAGMTFAGEIVFAGAGMTLGGVRWATGGVRWATARLDAAGLVSRAGAHGRGLLATGSCSEGRATGGRGDGVGADASRASSGKEAAGAAQCAPATSGSGAVGAGATGTTNGGRGCTGAGSSGVDPVGLPMLVARMGVGAAAVP
jgi:hypothetical protein